MVKKRGLNIFVLSLIVFSFLSIGFVSAGIFNLKGEVTGHVTLNSEGWTPWLDRDNPSGTGDWEHLSAFVDSEDVCESPVDIECQRVSDGVDASETGEEIVCTKDKGFICLNEDQDDGFCSDYEVRFNCGGIGGTCGNEIVEAGESCDDGNSASGDGCSSSCEIESGWDCTGSPSVCSENSNSCLTGSDCDVWQECHGGETGSGDVLGECVDISSCTDGDGFCPPECTSENDNDCTVSCSDSDGGKNYHVKGGTLGIYEDTNSSGRFSNEDFCYTNSSRMVEFFCNERGYLDSTFYNCPNGCSDGACIKEDNKTIECSANSDCPTINCVTEPCPKNVCVGGECVVKEVAKGEKISFGENSYCYEYISANKAECRIYVGDTISPPGDYERIPYTIDAYRFFYDADGSYSNFVALDISTFEGFDDRAIVYVGTKYSFNISNTSVIVSLTDISQDEGEIPFAEFVLSTGEDEGSDDCSSGCSLDETCYPIGYRDDGEYCSPSGEFVSQSGEEAICDNNFECSTNLCIDNQCVSGNFIQRVFEWFRRISS